MEKDQEIIKQCLNGNSAAFGVLFDRYFSKIYAFIYYKTNHRETAEDLASLTFVKAWDNLKQYEGESFQAWIYAIARNNISDHYRRTKPTCNIEDCWDLADEEKVVALADAQFARQRLRQAMAQLGVEDREILIMRYWQDLSFKEISGILGKGESALKMKVYRVLDELKKDYFISPMIFVLLRFLYE